MPGASYFTRERALHSNLYIVIVMSHFIMLYMLSTARLAKGDWLASVCYYAIPRTISRNENVIMTSNRYRHVVFTPWLRYNCVVCPLGQCIMNGVWTVRHILCYVSWVKDTPIHPTHAMYCFSECARNKFWRKCSHMGAFSECIHRWSDGIYGCNIWTFNVIIYLQYGLLVCVCDYLTISFTFPKTRA